jgi:Protein of unknown function (DUF3034)
VKQTSLARAQSTCAIKKTIKKRALATAFMALTISTPSFAQQGKLLLTGGVSSIEGAAGGGLTPWAVTGSYASAGEFGATAHATYVRSEDFALAGYGVAATLYDRLELSVARQEFDTRAAGAALGLGAGFKFKQNIYGAKLRIAGDAVLDSDTLMPQVAIGVQHKRNEQGNVVRLIGAKDDVGTDFYLSATKLFLAQGILLNGTLRATQANQNGVLGFGGDKQSSYQLMPEISVAYLVNRNLAIGAEYRKKPSNLGFAREQDWADAFIAWAPSKHVSLTAAYVSLGDIATVKNQHGWYLSAQLAF